jgi:hypothetical protein
MTNPTVPGAGSSSALKAFSRGGDTMRNEAMLIDRLPESNEEEIKKYKKVIEAVQVTKELDLLEKDRIVQLFLIELSKTPDNEVLWRALNNHLKPHLIKNELKPAMFKIPPEE